MTPPDVIGRHPLPRLHSRSSLVHRIGEMALTVPRVDVVCLGLNAADTIIRLPCFPAFDSKVEFLSADLLLGGQVASAMAACQFWGLRTRYLGKLGDDHAGELHRREFERLGVEAHLQVVPCCASQQAFILVDEPSGERTILWRRDARLAIQADEFDRALVVNARLLHVDGHNCPAAAQAALWAHEAGLPVVGDVDNLYPGLETLLGRTDYLVSSQEFPVDLTGEASLEKALCRIAQAHPCRLVAATLGRDGVLAWLPDRPGGRFLYHPAYQVETVDTTGAGDIFHAGFLYALLQGWPIERVLGFSCAGAALNCTALGARGGIRPVAEIERLRQQGPVRAPAPDFVRYNVSEAPG